MYRYALEVMYNGVCFHGSQVQGELATVQRALDEALTVLLKQPMVTYGASRTDEGVHALCNFYHFDVETPIDFDLLYKLNAITSAGLSAKRLVAIAPDANVRFDAISRR